VGYFDALSEALFKTDENGDTLFYPWGAMGRGVVLDTPERKERIGSFITLYYGAIFLYIAVMQFAIMVMHTDLFKTTLLFCGIGALMGVWYLVRLASMTKGLPYSKTRLGIHDAWRKTAVRLPRFMVVGGFAAMVLLSAGSVAGLIFLDGSIAWALALMLALGLFGTYAYYRMMIYAKEAPPAPVIVPYGGAETAEDAPQPDAMRWNARNTAIIAALFVATVAVVYYISADSQKGFDERMARYSTMNAEEMAAYLGALNAEAEKIDPVTLHAGTDVNGSVITFYRELSSGILSSIVVDLSELEQEQAKMTRQLRREMCGLPTWDLFYQKGGSLKFVYHLVADNAKTHMFDITVDGNLCR